VLELFLLDVFPPKFAPCLVLAATLVAPFLAHADPGYYVVTPYDNAGLRTIDVRYWTFKPTNKKEYIWPEIGFA
jgi:hypothetical protein